MGKCLSKISRPVDARSYFEEAESICRQKLRRVLSTGGSADTLTFCEVTSKNLSLVPSVFMHELSEKVGTATLYELQRECEKKLKNLPLQFIPIPIEANCSTRWTHFGVDGRGVKRQFSPGISTEANLPTKKRSDRTFIFKETS